MLSGVSPELSSLEASCFASVDWALLISTREVWICFLLFLSRAHLLGCTYTSIHSRAYACTHFHTFIYRHLHRNIFHTIHYFLLLLFKGMHRYDTLGTSKLGGLRRSASAPSLESFAHLLLPVGATKRKNGEIQMGNSERYKDMDRSISIQTGVHKDRSKIDR